MRLTEVSLSWEDIVADAQQRGLVIRNSGTERRPKYVMHLPAEQIEAVRKKYNIQYIYGAEYKDLFSAEVKRNQYGKQAQKLETFLKNPAQLDSAVAQRVQESALAELLELKNRDPVFQPGRYQLYVPRASEEEREHQDLEGFRQRAAAAAALTEWNNPPVLGMLGDPSADEPARSSNKPTDSFWTSTARPTEVDGKKYWSSSWSNWVYHNQATWANDIGYLYEWTPSARILILHSNDQVVDLSNIWARLNNQELANSYDHGFQIKLPWNWVKRHWDAMHHRGGYGHDYNSFFMGWDVESTAWFRPAQSLRYLGQVRVATPQDD